MPPNSEYLLLDDQPASTVRVDPEGGDGEDVEDADVEVRGDDEPVDRVAEELEPGVVAERDRDERAQRDGRARSTGAST